MIINPLFVHRGVTVLAHFKSGNALTLEAVYFGVSVALSMAAVIFIFVCFTKIMTGDRIICLTGRVSPSLSLVLSMALGFAPRFKERFNAVREARRGIDGGSFKGAVKTMSAMLTWSLESGVVTADSMRGRGFGCTRRTSYSVFSFKKKDALLLSLMAVELALFVIFMQKHTYFPSFSFELSAASFVPYCLFLLTPLFVGEGDENS